MGVYKDNEGNSALVVSVDGKVKRPEGGVFHITTSVAKGSKAMILGSLCETAYDEWLESQESEVFTPVEFNDSAMCNEEGNCHALSWLLSKKGSKPIPVCLDVDGTTFLCNQKIKTILINLVSSLFSIHQVSPGRI